jgi:hypothetical protein
VTVKSVIRIKVLKSHYQYRASKSQDKAVLELATRWYSSEVKQLLIKLLTEANAEVQAAHESERGQELLSGDKSLPDDDDTTNIEFDVLSNRLATTVQDPMDLDIDIGGGETSGVIHRIGSTSSPSQATGTLHIYSYKDRRGRSSNILESQIRGRKRKAGGRDRSGTPSTGAEEEDTLLEESRDQHSSVHSSDAYSDTLDPSDDDLDYDDHSVVSDEAGTRPALSEVMGETYDNDEVSSELR